MANATSRLIAFRNALRQRYVSAMNGDPQPGVDFISYSDALEEAYGSFTPGEEESLEFLIKDLEEVTTR